MNATLAFLSALRLRGLIGVELSSGALADLPPPEPMRWPVPPSPFPLERPWLRVRCGRPVVDA